MMLRGGFMLKRPYAAAGQPPIERFFREAQCFAPFTSPLFGRWSQVLYSAPWLSATNKEGTFLQMKL